MAQDVFMRLYRSRHRYQPRARFGTWLFHICQNSARNALRTRRRHPCVPLGQLAGPEGDDLPVETIASAAGTIGYEPVCSITRRVRFVED